LVPILDLSYYNENYLRHKREIDSLDDCFDDLEEPSYGFRVKVTLVENSPCILGSTCRGPPTARSEEESWNDVSSDAYYPTDDVIERQTGEEFFSEAPPDCRVTCQ
jgi:hypothetical protein